MSGPAQEATDRLVESGQAVGILLVNFEMAETADDERVERIVVGMIDAALAAARQEDASAIDLVCAAFEFAARLGASPFVVHPGQATRQQKRKFAQDMAENVKRRVLGCLDLAPSGTERVEQ
jgi:sugar phosphate isomerase/epimerase